MAYELLGAILRIDWMVLAIIAIALVLAVLALAAHCKERCRRE